MKVDRKVRWVVRKILCLLFAGTLLVAVAAAQSGPTTPQALYQLVQQKDYLGLQSALAANPNLATVDSAVLKAVLANRKNQVADSIQLIIYGLSRPAMLMAKWKNIALSMLSHPCRLAIWWTWVER